MSNLPSDLIVTAVANRIGECDIHHSYCHTHYLRIENADRCDKMDDALIVAAEVERVVLADLREKAGALRGFNRDGDGDEWVDRDEVLHLLETGEPMGLDDSNLISWRREQEAQWVRERGQR